VVAQPGPSVATTPRISKLLPRGCWRREDRLGAVAWTRRVQESRSSPAGREDPPHYRWRASFLWT
jgi:hypothetical protein